MKTKFWFVEYGLLSGHVQEVFCRIRSTSCVRVNKDDLSQQTKSLAPRSLMMMSILRFKA